MQVTTAQLSKFEEIVAEVSAVWNKVKPISGKWFGVDSNSLVKGFTTVFSGVEQLVSFAETLSVPGVDKKAAVLASANMLFNNIIVPLLPTWAKPFSSVIQTIFDALLNAAIEYVVSKTVNANAV